MINLLVTAGHENTVLVDIVLLKRSDLMSQKYCARVYDNARAVVAYCFIGEILFGSFRSRRTAKKNATDTIAEEKNFARCNLLR